MLNRLEQTRKELDYNSVGASIDMVCNGREEDLGLQIMRVARVAAGIGTMQSCTVGVAA